MYWRETVVTYTKFTEPPVNVKSRICSWLARQQRLVREANGKNITSTTCHLHDFGKMTSAPYFDILHLRILEGYSNVGEGRRRMLAPLALVLVQVDSFFLHYAKSHGDSNTHCFTHAPVTSVHDWGAYQPQAWTTESSLSTCDFPEALLNPMLT